MSTIDRLILKLNKLGDESVDKALNKACLLVENAAKEKVPVNTGNLRNSITYEVEGNEGTVGTNVEYAPYVEFGTGLFSSQGDGRTDVPWRYQTADGEWHSTLGQNPQPYLQPALQENKDRIIEIFKQSIKETISD